MASSNCSISFNDFIVNSTITNYDNKVIYTISAKKNGVFVYQFTQSTPDLENLYNYTTGNIRRESKLEEKVLPQKQLRRSKRTPKPRFNMKDIMNFEMSSD
jgi:hypothetical protein